jgi:hypothetical protein
MVDRASTEATRSITYGGETLRRLLAERGVERYALFFTVGEGRFLPNGEEEISGSVLTPDGRSFGFWTAWDVARGRPCFRRWYEERPEPHWEHADEYRQARAAVGLD